LTPINTQRALHCYAARHEFDIHISGAGPAGLCLARALPGHGLRTALVAQQLALDAEAFVHDVTHDPGHKELIYDNGSTTSDLCALRRERIGFVFQAPYLIPFLDVTDNVALLPMRAGGPNAQARARALERLTALDVAHRAAGQ
jgi:hypothetical protein